MEKKFPNNTVETPIGEFNFNEKFLRKLNDRTTTRDKQQRRSEDFGLIKPTLESPEYIIVHKDKEEYGTLFMKSFKDDNGNVFYMTVLKEKKGKVVLVSATDGKESNIVNKFKEGKLLVYSRALHSAGSGGQGKKFSTLPGLLFSELEKGEVLHFSSSALSESANSVRKHFAISGGLLKFDEVSHALIRASGNAGNVRNFIKNDFAGRLVFNMQNDSDTVNEVWGEFIAVGKTRVRKIRYAVEGFEGSVDDGEYMLKNYANIDDYRKGVLMQRSRDG